MRRKLLLAVQFAAICFIIAALLVAYDLSAREGTVRRPFRSEGSLKAQSESFSHVHMTAPPHPVATTPAVTENRPANSTAYIAAIMNPDNKTFSPRLECPRPNAARYNYLKLMGRAPQKRHYFFAIDIRQKVAILPTLIGSVVEAMRLLNPKICSLSIVEGNSDDGTRGVLEALRPHIEALGATYHFQSSAINPATDDRIARLAQLRNLALAPLVDHPEVYAAVDSNDNVDGATSTTIVFLNDVALCPDDILELIHQRRVQHAHMMCAIDWTYVGADPTFYDVWIARTIAGDLFFDIPPDGNWNSAWNLFWNRPQDSAALNARRPFQVFSCWNGAVALDARPLLDRRLAFRAPRPGECYQGEPQLLCKDLWHLGLGRIAVVPSVNLEYGDEAAQRIKALKGYTGESIATEEPAYRIKWQDEPPEKVRCIPAGYDKQEWRPWDEALELSR